MTPSSSPAPKTTDAGAALLARAGAAGIGASLEPAQVVVGAVCESEPLYAAERMLAAAQPDAIVRGVAAAMVATGAGRGLLAVRADWPDARAALESAARGSTVEVAEVDAWYPVDELVAEELGIVGACTVPARALAALDRLARGQAEGPHWLTIVGAIREPRVVAVAPGCTVGDLVGDATVLDWVALAGALRGPALDRDQPVDREIGGLWVLPAGHDLVRRRRETGAWARARARSACLECRVCTDSCPTALLGAPLEPHRVMRALAHRLVDPTIVTGALACIGCALCDVVCPSALHPGAVVGELAEALRAEGLWAAGALTHAAAPHPDRRGRRLAIDLLTDRLGLGVYRQPLLMEMATARSSTSNRPSVVGSVATSSSVAKQTSSQSPPAAGVPPRTRAR
jgi:Na+-translocating ferredoxin:NAD+ oxidoreductase RnfC subunit